MSWGSLVGAAAGGVIGFFIGGPVGALYGAGIGFGVGFAIDPLTPDVSTTGTPDQKLQIASNIIGTPIPDALGTVKITGQLLLYGNERSEDIKQDVGGKGGGDQEQVVGKNYYMTWVVGICKGPIDRIHTIFADNDAIWYGPLDRPASGGVQTITREGFGTIRIYFGTDDQEADPAIADLLGDSTLNSPMRGMCYAVMDDCLIGSSRRCPTLRFIVTKLPEITALSAVNTPNGYDYNPAHASWYILSSMAGLREEWLDATSFDEAAWTLVSESMGVSFLLDNPRDVRYCLEAINSHVASIIRYDSDGKFHFKLIRGDYTIDDLPEVTDAELLEEPTLQRKAWIDTINELKVEYTERFFVKSSRATCDDVAVLSWDSAPSTIPSGGSVQLSVTGGEPPYTWSVESEGGVFYLDTAGPDLSESNTLHAASEMSCEGNAVVRVRDWCEQEIELTVSLEPMTLDEEATSETIDPDGYAVVAVNGGVLPITFSVTPFPDYSINGQQSVTVNSRSAVIYAAPGSCGYCTVEVSDVCGTVVSVIIKNTNGTWANCAPSSAIGGCHTDYSLYYYSNEVCRTLIYCGHGTYGIGSWTSGCNSYQDQCPLDGHSSTEVCGGDKLCSYNNQRYTCP